LIATHGLGKTIQAIAATEILAVIWRLESAGRLPDLAQIPMAKRDHALRRARGDNAARVINGGRPQRQKDYALDDFCKITNYEKLKPDSILIAAGGPNW